MCDSDIIYFLLFMILRTGKEGCALILDLASIFTSHNIVSAILFMYFKTFTIPE